MMNSRCKTLGDKFSQRPTVELTDELQIKEGVMVGPASEEAANIGRKFSKRQMPW